MTKEEAKEILKFHSFSHDDIDNPKMTRGFLGVLRPFTGELKRENYIEIMEALKILSDEIRDNDTIEKDIISSIWGICHLARSWAIEPEGMLQHNNLISQKQIKELEEWIDSISYATFMLLDGCDIETAFEFYDPCG